MTILAILVRHATAAPSPNDPDGIQRITNSGRKRQETVNSIMKDYEIQPTEMWSSPVTRAQETAEIIGKAFNVTPETEVALGELEMFDEAIVTSRLSEVPDESTIILVSHAPQILRLSTYWIGKRIYGTSPPTSSATLIKFTHKVEPGKGEFVRIIAAS